MRYKLIAYVCSQQCIKWENNIGTLDYGEILSRRSEDCRFAILEADNIYLCVDMFETQMDQNLNIIMPPALTFTTVDAAVMAAQLKF